MKRKKTYVLTAVVALAILVGLTRITHAFNKERFLSQIIHLSLERWHFSEKKIDDDFSIKGFDEYLRMLDYHKRFFLRSDIEEFSRYQQFIDDELLQGSTRLMGQASVRLMNRIREVEGFYEGLLTKPFDYSKQEFYESDRDKKDYCVTTTELMERWRKLLKYQCLINYANLLSNKTDGEGDAELEEKSRGTVLKSYRSLLSQLLQAHENDSLPLYLNSLLQVYDPHSGYFPPKAKQDFDIEMTGKFEGIGALLSEEEGYVKVARIIPGGPSWRQRELEAGDLIIKVAQAEGEPVDIVGMRVVDAVKLIRGKKESLVKLTVKKPDGRIVVIPIVRDVVVVEETFAKWALLHNKSHDKSYGYIYLPRFYRDFSKADARNATGDVKRALQELVPQGIAGVILDLRNNSGGSLQDAVDISGLFIPRGPVVQVKNKQRGARVLQNKKKKPIWDGPLVVLINALSASASEILAAAMQDYSRAVIVGSEHSFGKGTVQIMLNLDQYLAALSEEEKVEDPEEVGALKLTVQKFYRITGSSSQFKGVVPDVILPDRYNYMEIGERYLDHALVWDSIPAVPFKLWRGQRLPIQRIATESEERVRRNPHFKRMGKYIAKLKGARHQTQKSLKLQDYLDEQKKLRAEEKRVNEARKPLPHISVSAPMRQPAQVQADEERPEERRKIAAQLQSEWFEQLKKDLYLEEAMNVIFDVLSASPPAPQSD